MSLGEKNLTKAPFAMYSALRMLVLLREEGLFFIVFVFISHMHFCPSDGRSDLTVLSQCLSSHNIQT